MIFVSSQQGFSLVETLVAISILLLVMIGPMTISMSAARSTNFSSEQVTAFFLAQEGAELAQKARDDLQLIHFSGTTNNPWSSFKNQNGTYRACYTNDGCGLSIGSNQTGSVGVAECGGQGIGCQLYLDTQTGNGRSRFSHDSSDTATLYTRRIFFQTVAANPDEVKIISRVTWRNGSFRFEQKAEVETRLFNVYGN